MWPTQVRGHPAGAPAATRNHPRPRGSTEEIKYAWHVPPLTPRQHCTPAACSTLSSCLPLSTCRMAPAHVLRTQWDTAGCCAGGTEGALRGAGSSLGGRAAGTMASSKGARNKSSTHAPPAPAPQPASTPQHGAPLPSQHVHAQEPSQAQAAEQQQALPQPLADERQREQLLQLVLYDDKARMAVDAVETKIKLKKAKKRKARTIQNWSAYLHGKEDAKSVHLGTNTLPAANAHKGAKSAPRRPAAKGNKGRKGGS
jgi:hypothetical protein